MLLHWTELWVSFHNLNSPCSGSAQGSPRFRVSQQANNFWWTHSQYKQKRGIERDDNLKQEGRNSYPSLHTTWSLIFKYFKYFKYLAYRLIHPLWQTLISQAPIHFQGIDAVCFPEIPELREDSIWETKRKENPRVLNALSLHAKPACKNKLQNPKSIAHICMACAWHHSKLRPQTAEGKKSCLIDDSHLLNELLF